MKKFVKFTALVISLSMAIFFILSALQNLKMEEEAEMKYFLLLPVISLFLGIAACLILDMKKYKMNFESYIDIIGGVGFIVCLLGSSIKAFQGAFMARESLALASIPFAMGAAFLLLVVLFIILIVKNPD